MRQSHFTEFVKKVTFKDLSELGLDCPFLKVGPFFVFCSMLNIELRASLQMLVLLGYSLIDGYSVHFPHYMCGSPCLIRLKALRECSFVLSTPIPGSTRKAALTIQ